MPRNNWVGLPIHRVDMKLAWPIPAGAYEIEASVEIFNLFNHANFYTYVTNESSPSYGNRVSRSWSPTCRLRRPSA